MNKGKAEYCLAKHNTLTNHHAYGIENETTSKCIMKVTDQRLVLNFEIGFFFVIATQWIECVLKKCWCCINQSKIEGWINMTNNRSVSKHILNIFFKLYYFFISPIVCGLGSWLIWIKAGCKVVFLLLFCMSTCYKTSRIEFEVEETKNWAAVSLLLQWSVQFLSTLSDFLLSTTFLYNSTVLKISM